MNNKLTKLDWDYYKYRYPEYLRNDGVVDMSKIWYDLLITCNGMKSQLIKMFDINNVLYSNDGVDYIDYITGINDYYAMSRKYRSDIGSLEGSNDDPDGYYHSIINKPDVTHLESYDTTPLKHRFIYDSKTRKFTSELSERLEDYHYWNDEMYSQVLDFIGKSFGVNRMIKIKWLANTPEYGGHVYYENNKDKNDHYVRLNNYNYLKLIRFQIIKNNTNGTREDMNELYKSIDLPISIYNSPDGIDLIAELHFELKYLNKGGNSNNEYNVNYMDKQMFLNGYYDMDILGVSITRFASFAEYVSNYAMLINDDEKESMSNDFSSPSKFAAVWLDVEDPEDPIKTVFDVANKQSEIKFDSAKNRILDSIPVKDGGIPTFNEKKYDQTADYWVIGYGVWN